MKTAIALTIAAIAAALLPGQWLELQRGGGAWRFVTCHFTHWTFEQLAWDGLAFTALALACARRNRIAFHATLLASVIVVPAAVLLFAPSLSAYRGLSGVASALFALLFTQMRLTWPVALCATGLAAKIGYEVFAGNTLFVQDLGAGVVPVPVAHIAGALAGLAVGLVTTHVQLRSCASSSPRPSCSPA